MNMQRRSIIHILLLGCLLGNAASAFAWHDRTHMAVVEAAGVPKMAYLAVGADMVKEKFPNEQLNHFCNNLKGAVISPKMVLDQEAFYNEAESESGHLYGAINAALDNYREGTKVLSKYALYPLGYAMHYIGDLSMPLHNIEFTRFNRANHGMNDGVVDSEPQLVNEIRSRMANYKIKIDPQKFRESLAVQIAQIAVKSVALGYHLQDSNTPVMSKIAAYEQLAQSAALLRAVFIALDISLSEQLLRL